MSKDKSAASKTADDENEPGLLSHVKSLGLATVDDYRTWCRERGLCRRLAKTWRERCKERAIVSEAVVAERLKRKKCEARNPGKVIQAVFADELGPADVTPGVLRAICGAYEQVKACRRAKLALRDTLLHVERHSDLLTGETEIDRHQFGDRNKYVDGLTAACLQECWLRPCETWRPRTHNRRRQFSSLVRHLFAQWPVPAFMDSAWFKGVTPAAKRQQGWFLHLGRGSNIRTADLPIPYSKRMAHWFMHAPDDLSVEGALRYGQVLGLGGDERLVRAIEPTRLGSGFEHDDFWTTALRFFIANPLLDRAQIGPLVDYVQHQKYAPRVVDGETHPPPQPNFCMKGRTAESLMKQLGDWHCRLSKTPQPAGEWPASGIGDFEFIEGTEHGANLKIWTLTELLGSKALFAEGRAMKHCVASYAQSSARRQCAIFSLELETTQERRRLLTVEVCLAGKVIVQARGRCNQMASEKLKGVLRRWAAAAGLKVSKSI